eukprot:33698-Eustigmatos_ZCMA.PRE.1
MLYTSAYDVMVCTVHGEYSRLALASATPASAAFWLRTSHSILYLLTSPPPLSALWPKVVISERECKGLTCSEAGGSGCVLGDSLSGVGLPAATEYPNELYAYTRTKYVTPFFSPPM